MNHETKFFICSIFPQPSTGKYFFNSDHEHNTIAALNEGEVSQCCLI